MKTAVVAIIEKEGEILIGKKKTNPSDPLSGDWHIPGGHKELGENDEETLHREMKEELGIEITVGKLLATSYQPERKTTARWYICTTDTNENDIQAGDDLVLAKFVPKNEVAILCSDRAKRNWPKEVYKYICG